MKKLIITLAIMVSGELAFTQSVEGSEMSVRLNFIPKDSSFSTQLNTNFQSFYQGNQMPESDE